MWWGGDGGGRTGDGGGFYETDPVNNEGTRGSAIPTNCQSQKKISSLPVCVYSTLGGYHEYIGGYLEYIGECSVHRGDIIILVGEQVDKNL